MRYQRITPNNIIKRLCKNIEQDSLVLEPSAGDGLICDYLVSKNINVHAFELNSEKRDLLKQKNIKVIGANFLEYTPAPIYDHVVMCPPFYNNNDTLHVLHAFKYLKPGGSIRALMNPSFFTNNQPNQVLFRTFLNNNFHRIKVLPDNTFIEKSKNVPTIYIEIYK